MTIYPSRNTVKIDLIMMCFGFSLSLVLMYLIGNYLYFVHVDDLLVQLALYFSFGIMTMLAFFGLWAISDKLKELLG